MDVSSVTVNENFIGGTVKATRKYTEGFGTEMKETAPVEVDGVPVIAVATNEAPQEGHEFTLDASPSYDPNGDAVTFAWRQVGGPVVDYTMSGDAKALTFMAPEVDSDHLTAFELTVAEENASTVQSIPVLGTKEGAQ